MSDEQANPPGEQQGQQYGYNPPQYGYAQPQFAPPPPQPTNGYALASIITSSLSMATLFFTAGLASPLTAIASGIGAVLGHKGKDDVDKGRAVSQRDLSVAGLWVGVAGVVLSVLALIAWVALIVLMIAFDDATWAEELNREFESDWDQP